MILILLVISFFVVSVVVSVALAKTICPYDRMVSDIEQEKALRELKR